MAELKKIKQIINKNKNKNLRKQKEEKLAKAYTELVFKNYCTVFPNQYKSSYQSTTGWKKCEVIHRFLI